MRIIWGGGINLSVMYLYSMNTKMALPKFHIIKRIAKRN